MLCQPIKGGTQVYPGRSLWTMRVIAKSKCPQHVKEKV